MYGRESTLSNRSRVAKKEVATVNKNESITASNKESAQQRLKLPCTNKWHLHKSQSLLISSLFIATVSLSFLLLKTRYPNETTAHEFAPVIVETTAMTNRFPVFGSQEFQDTCSWTIPPPNSNQNCTILVRPRPTEHEGMTQWLCILVTHFIDSRVRNCRFLADYGPDVDLSKVIAPNFNWIAPKDYKCHSSHDCHQGRSGFIRDREPNIPFYRSVYNKIATQNSRVSNAQFQNLSKALPGFSLENGMSCSLAALFDLAPTSATQYEPQLFSKILPTLRDPNALVVTVYIRTGQTDQMVRQERNSSIDNIAMQAQLKTAKMSTTCAMQVEQEFLANSNHTSYSRVVWNVVTDSFALKERMRKEFSSENIWQDNNSKDNQKPIPRIVITTSARGKHTRTMRKPSTADFAEALIDFYLIGESDVVVSESTLPSSFETTASLRTNRPLYITPESKGDEILPCQKKRWIYD